MSRRFRLGISQGQFKSYNNPRTISYPGYSLLVVEPSAFFKIESLFSTGRMPSPSKAENQMFCPCIFHPETAFEVKTSPFPVELHPHTIFDRHTVVAEAGG